MKLIYQCTYGSRLYGTELPESDVDVRGVYLPTADEILLGRAPPTLGRKDAALDSVCFSVQRFVELLTQGQSVALEMLFAPPEKWLAQDPTWYDVLQVAPRLISKNCKAAVGYARSQAERYSMRGDRKKVLECVLGLLANHSDELMTDEFVDSYRAILSQQPFVRLGAGHLQVLEKRFQYNIPVERMRATLTTLHAKYGARSQDAALTGADWKALYHAVRISEQTIELLETGSITLPRWNAADLRKIRLGAYPPERVYERIEEGFARVEAAQRASDLPDEPDLEAADNLIRRLHQEVVCP